MEMPVQRSERRANVRRGVVTRVALDDNEPSINATTRNLSLIGMCLITATRSLPAGHRFVAAVSVERRGGHEMHRISVRVVWSDNKSAGVEFERVAADTRAALREMLEESEARRRRTRHAR